MQRERRTSFTDDMLGRRSRRRLRAVLPAALLLACVVTSPTVVAAAGGTVTVEVVNALSRQPLIGLRVVAKRRAGTQYTAVATRTTDGAGRAVFALTDLSPTAPYAFFTTPYNGGTVQSIEVTAARLLRFEVGRLPVSVVAGGTNAPLISTKVSVKERLADGSLKWITSGITDGKGLIIFDPPGLGSGRVFFLEALSPWDGTYKRSNDVTDVAGFTFVVGNAPLNVTLVDGLSMAPLAGKKLSAYQRLTDATLKYVASRTTDTVGRAVFDLDRLGSGSAYVLRVVPFNGGTTDSEDLTAAGEYLFKVGTLSVKVVRGGTGAVIPNTRVIAYERLADGKLTSVKQGTTDGQGIVRFDLPGLGQGRSYVLSAVSPWDGTTKFSNPLTRTGAVVFTVGNAPLRVTLLNGLSGAPLPGLTLSARERLSNGSSVAVTSRTTDQAGKAVFDLAGLGNGRVYFLSTAPYNTGPVSSDDLSAPGDFEFKVGMLEVTVVNGSTSAALGNLAVNARERLSNGQLVWIKGGTTDAGGKIRFDLPGLGKGRTYVLDARSPSDGSIKRSSDITKTGRYTFVVGNAPLRVRLTNALSGDALAGVTIVVHERPATGSLQWAASRVTDGAGGAIFDLPGLGSGRTYVLSCVPYNGGTAYSEDLRAAGEYEFRVGDVEVTVVNGATGTPLANFEVGVKARLADGSYDWLTGAITDAQGLVRFDVPGFTGRVYVLQAVSPTDGSTKLSQDITAIGKYVFRVGNAPLTVTLVNGVSGAALRGMTVIASERLADGSLEWSAQRTTDTAGRAVFDLNGLGAGRVYVLSCEPYTAGVVYSDDLVQTGPYRFRVGTLEVSVVNGATAQPWAGAAVSALEVLADGTVKFVKQGVSDPAGVIRFDLPGLGKGKRYVLQAVSPADGTTKRSAEISQEGRVTFVVGNPALRITLINGVSRAPLAGVSISAKEVLADGTYRWTGSRATDSAGVASYDLEGLGSGRAYALFVQPYNGGWVVPAPLDRAGSMFFRVGTVPVTLVDADTNRPLAGKTLGLFEKLSDGKLLWIKQGVTDSAGIVQFDLENLGPLITPQAQPPPPSGRVFVLRTDAPFGEDKRYYGPLVAREGPVRFAITRAGTYPLDVTAPQVSITAPSTGASVDVNGFTVTGAASDDVTLAQVVVTLSDPVVGETRLTATYNTPTRTWSVSVPGARVTAGASVRITATAYDQVQNQSNTMVTVKPVRDAVAPRITFTSHQNGDSVAKTGFLLSGTATDDLAVTSLIAAVDDPVLGRSVNQQPVAVAGDGRWTLAVSSGRVTAGRQIVVTMSASDAYGRRTTATIQLGVVAVDSEAHHLINRITFGATAALLADVERSGAAAFLAQQLAPASIDDSAFNALIAGVPVATKADLQRYALLHAVHSRRQLREVMTQFWDNHFNTDINKHNVVAYERAEHALFRQHALGRFRDLLEVSATSPAMLLYLDNSLSKRSEPNENYARELMELHTLGVDGGYTQTDVEQVAKAFTGWSVQNATFFFNAELHDTAAKTVLGQVIPAGGGIEDGQRVLDILSTHPSTARFICTKLGQLFVSDTPLPLLTDRCAATFLASGGAITPVLQTILQSPEFGDPANFRGKVKTPLEFVVAVVRNLDASTTGADLITPMAAMGLRLFENPVPTGWSETGDDWTNSNLLLQRINFANQVARATANTTVQPRTFFSANGETTADGIVSFLFELLFHDEFTALEYEAAFDVLTDGGTRPFDINAPDADTRLRRMLGTALSIPGYQYQ